MIPLFTQEEFNSAKSRQKLSLKCIQCDNEFLKSKNEIQQILSGNNGKTGNFCSRLCITKNNDGRTLIPCKTCNNPVLATNKRSQGNVFCSIKCAAIYNSPKQQKRKKIKKYCQKCNEEITRQTKTKLCIVCRGFNKVELFGDKTIKEIEEESKLFTQRNKYEKIRQHAKRIAKYHNLKKECKICGYSNHVELAHIKAISDFDKNTTLKIVNEKSNLSYLCPNHHWELDNAFFSLI